jgi:hypothetical protein
MADSIPARAVAYLKTLEAGARVSSKDIAEAIGYAGTSLAQLLRAARDAGEIASEGNRRTTVWFLPDGAEGGEETEEDDAPVEFNAALWADGDLVIYGAQANEDGSITLNREQLATVKRLIAWSPAP